MSLVRHAPALALALASLWAAAWPASAHARVERFALVIGNNHGHAEDGPLRYAEADAERLRSPARERRLSLVNMVLLGDEAVDTVRSTLIALNQRIRDLVAEPDTQVVLFVYYSGHADAERLHLDLGTSDFAVGELAQLVRGSAASFRLVVLDACRSGALTRLKGGRLVPPFALPEERLQGTGMAYLTASAESEDAQGSVATLWPVLALTAKVGPDPNDRVPILDLVRKGTITAFGSEADEFELDKNDDGTMDFR